MTAVVFETPGLIDVRAFTIMGAHAKPNAANPIGYFGTGLKYAVAVLVRLGCEPVVWIGRDRFTFSKKATKFRGADLETIKMTVLKDGNRRSTSYEMPYTTAYGRNWEPWQAFRELESNTRDEGGKTWLAEPEGVENIIKAGGTFDDKTLIVVDQPDFLEAARKIDTIFLPRARREGRLLDAIEVDDRPDADDAYYIFYRTMRAMKIDKPTLYTYNVLEAQTLTEDRTLMFEYRVRDVIARWVLTEATEAQIEKIVTADDEWFEHKLEFPGHVAPSDAFKAVMARRPKGTSSSAWAYWGGWHTPAPQPRVRSFSLFEHFPKPWKPSGDVIVCETGEVVFERPDNMSSWVWDELAAAVVRRLEAGALPPDAESVDEEPDEETPAEPVLAEDTEPAADDRIPF